MTRRIISLLFSSVLGLAVAHGQADSTFHKLFGSPCLEFVSKDTTKKWTKIDTVDSHSGHPFIVYYEDSAISKLVTAYHGATASYYSEYYVEDNKLFLIKYSRWTVYFGNSGGKCYFINGKMTKWVNCNEQSIENKSKEFSDQEVRVLQQFDELMAKAKSKK